MGILVQNVKSIKKKLNLVEKVGIDAEIWRQVGQCILYQWKSQRNENVEIKGHNHRLHWNLNLRNQSECLSVKSIKNDAITVQKWMLEFECKISYQNVKIKS